MRNVSAICSTNNRFPGKVHFETSAPNVPQRLRPLQGEITPYMLLVTPRSKFESILVYNQFLWTYEVAQIRNAPTDPPAVTLYIF